jgi:hypothetical protein
VELDPAQRDSRFAERPVRHYEDEMQAAVARRGLAGRNLERPILRAWRRECGGVSARRETSTIFKHCAVGRGRRSHACGARRLLRAIALGLAAAAAHEGRRTRDAAPRAHAAVGRRARVFGRRRGDPETASAVPISKRCLRQPRPSLVAMVCAFTGPRAQPPRRARGRSLDADAGTLRRGIFDSMSAATVFDLIVSLQTASSRVAAWQRVACTAST